MSSDNDGKHTCVKCGKEKKESDMYEQEGDKYCCKDCCDGPKQEQTQQEAPTCSFC